MIARQPWHHAFIEALRQHLANNEHALALVVFGTAQPSNTTTDAWSDVDLLLISTDDGLATFFPSLEWLRPFGIIYASEQHQNALTHTTRLCYEDMRRVDIVGMTETELQQYDQVRFWQPGQILFAKDMTVTNQLLQPNHISPFSLPTTQEFEQMVNQFWYRSTVAVYKVIRNDLLIAWHLSLELIQDCCVLGMMLRDRQEQTNHHHCGGFGNEIITQLPTWPESYSEAIILVIIAEVATLFDQLAGQWSAHYKAKKRPLLEWIQALQTRQQTVTPHDE